MNYKGKYAGRNRVMSPIWSNQSIICPWIIGRVELIFNKLNKKKYFLKKKYKNVEKNNKPLVYIMSSYRRCRRVTFAVRWRFLCRFCHRYSRRRPDGPTVPRNACEFQVRRLSARTLRARDFGISRVRYIVVFRGFVFSDFFFFCFSYQTYTRFVIFVCKKKNNPGVYLYFEFIQVFVQYNNTILLCSSHVKTLRDNRNVTARTVVNKFSNKKKV